MKTSSANLSPNCFGYEFLGRHHLYWVLSRITVEIVRPLKWGDQALVVTWPKDVDGLLYLRDFEVKDQHGEVVARSTSGWLAIDMDREGSGFVKSN